MKEQVKKLINILGLTKVISPIYKYLVIDPYMKKRKKDYNHYNKELLFLFDDALTRKGYRYWLNCGTLLGAYRDQQFIASDNDLDVAMFLEDKDGVLETLTEAGLKLFAKMEIDGYGCMAYRFEYKNTFIDINFFMLVQNELVTYDGNFIPGANYSVKNVRNRVLVEKIVNPYTGFMKYSFLGRDFLIPQNTDDYLIANYGVDYMKPCGKSFDYHDVALNLTCYTQEEATGYFTRFS